MATVTLLLRHMAYDRAGHGDSLADTSSFNLFGLIEGAGDIVFSNLRAIAVVFISNFIGSWQVSNFIYGSMR